MKVLPKYIIALIAVGAVIFAITLIQQKSPELDVSKCGSGNELNLNCNGHAADGLTSADKNLIANDAAMLEKSVNYEIDVDGASEKIISKKLVLPISEAEPKTTQYYLSE